MRVVNSAISIWLPNALRLKFSTYRHNGRYAMEKVWKTARKKRRQRKKFRSVMARVCVRVFHAANTLSMTATERSEVGTWSSYVFVVYFSKTSKSNCTITVSATCCQCQCYECQSTCDDSILAFCRSFFSAIFRLWLRLLFQLLFTFFLFFDHENLWNCIARHPRENLTIISLFSALMLLLLFRSFARPAITSITKFQNVLFFVRTPSASANSIE